MSEQMGRKSPEWWLASHWLATSPLGRSSHHSYSGASRVMLITYQPGCLSCLKKMACLEALLRHPLGL